MTNDKMREDNEAFVQRIIKSIEDGVPMWRKGWDSSEFDIEQSNPVTGNSYSGINFVRLYLEKLDNNYSENRWATFNQIKSKGWKLEKGAKGVPVYKWTEYDRSTRTIPDWDTINKMNLNDRAKYVQDNVYCCMTNSGYVFNADHITGIEKKPKVELTEEEKKTRDNEIVPAIENIIKNCDVPITYDGKGRAFYRPSTDSIHLPEKEKFYSKANEYSTTLHEIAHSTGHEKRLNRLKPGTVFGSENYAREELVAEMSSMLMSIEVGRNMTQVEFENHSAYLESWVEVLKKDYTEFFKAVTDAKQVTNYIKENYWKDSSKKEESSELSAMKNNLPKNRMKTVLANSQGSCLE